MPLELIEDFDTRKRILSPGDRGFLITAKNRFHKTMVYHAIKWLKRYSTRYYEARYPEEAAAAKEAALAARAANGEEVKEETMEEEKEEEQESKEENQDEGNTEEGKEGETNEEGGEETNKEEEFDYTGIQFVERELVSEAFAFVGTNLPDTSDYLYFVFSMLGENYKTEKKTKFPVRFMPVDLVCESKHKQVETLVYPLIEKYVGQTQDSYRFALAFKKGSAISEQLSPYDARALIRNMIWSVNPNCIQCIKYQDFSIMFEMFDPLFLLGVAKDYNMLGGYNTFGLRNGLQVPGSDSEDDISDDPNLEEGENMRRRLRIKRKRRAEKAGLAEHNGNAKKSQDGQEDEEEKDEDQGEEEEGDDDAGDK